MSRPGIPGLPVGGKKGQAVCPLPAPGGRRPHHRPETVQKNRREFFEFKHFQLRMPGYFRPGGVFVLTHGFVKKQDRIPPQELERARAIRAECEERGQP
ncbi:MAG: type II toxin-antitoxin system RelE/ParE family toxin [Syntrophobacterales bacterium]|nr:type II toxin-antitoxin system RelE/ParE family toxin [Syntrophobacterales bacterium]